MKQVSCRIELLMGACVFAVCAFTVAYLLFLVGDFVNGAGFNWPWFFLYLVWMAGFIFFYMLLDSVNKSRHEI